MRRLVLATLLCALACPREPTEPLPACEAQGTCLPKLRVEGRSIPDAIVVAFVGGAELQSESDSDGFYGIDLGMRGADEVVVVRARGTGAADFVHLASVVGDVGSLSSNAGADRTVEPSEDHDLFVTPLSTARYSAYVGANGGRAPSTRAELELAEDNLNEPMWADDMLRIACAIRLLMDRTGPSLPSGFATTLQLAEDLDALWRFVEPLLGDGSSPSPLDAARDELLSDPTSVAPIGAIEPGTYYLDLIRSRNGLPGEGGSRLELEADGRGIAHNIYGRSIRDLGRLTSFTWSIEQERLKLAYSPPIEYEFYFATDQLLPLISDPAVRNQARAVLGPDGGAYLRYEILDDEISFLARGRLDWTVTKTRIRWHFDEALAPYNITAAVEERVDPPYGNDWRSARTLDLLPFTREELVGDWALRLVSPLDGDSSLFPQGTPVVMSSRVTLRADGTALASYGFSGATLTFDWVLDTEGRLVLTSPDGAEHTYAKWTELRGSTGNIMWFRSASGETYAHYDRDAKIDPAFALSPQIFQSNSGEFWQTTIYSYLPFFPSDGSLPYFTIFGFIFEANEAATQLIGDSVSMTVERAETWSLGVSTGSAAVEQRVDRDLAARCSATDPSCLALRRRTWLPVSMQDNLLTVLEFDTLLRDRNRVRRGEITWNDAQGAWLDASGIALDAGDVVYLIGPRLNAYYTTPIPP